MTASFDFASTLIAWQTQHGRHDLPWQQTRDPYRIWLSEIMLQQTQVSAVLAYYQRFLARFPSLASLANAPLDEVLGLWSGLGYYSRARNLHRCAQTVMQRFNGKFPEQPELLLTLPGIGRSTAAAIAAFSAGQRAAILDGNVKRVLTRVFGMHGYPGERTVENQLWELAEALLPATQIEAYTQGLMDLGATLCTRGKPACLKRAEACPFSAQCVAYQTQQTAVLPMPKPRKAIPQRAVVLLNIWQQGRVLLERRPEQGIWGGLWSLPEWGHGDGSLPRPDAAVLQAAAAGLGKVRAADWMPRVDHTFTHFKLHIMAWRAELMTLNHPNITLAPQQQWWSLEDALALGLPAPIRRILGAP